MIRLSVMATVLALSTAAFAAETRTYDIKGMTCDGCVKYVKAQVCALKGVESCNVEVGKVVLSGNGLNDDEIKAAVDKAGYKVVGVEHADATMGADVKPAPGPTLDAKKSNTKAAVKARGGLKK